MQATEAQILPLRDIRLPAEPGFWPLAPGWWMLMVLLTVLLIILVIKWRHYAQKKRRWLDIDQQLSKLEFDYQTNQDPQKLLTGVSVFLRRFVKFQMQQNQASAMYGANWIAHLNQYHKDQPFAAFENALTQGVFQNSCEYDVNDLLHTTRVFIKQQVMKPTKPTKELQHV
jgi:hypothetical protein